MNVSYLSKNKIINKDHNNCKELFKEDYEKTDALHIEFRKFTMYYSERSEICHFWEVFINIVTKIKKSICVDRNGDCEGQLQLHAVQELMPIFRGSDSINYLRYASCHYALCVVSLCVMCRGI